MNMFGTKALKPKQSEDYLKMSIRRQTFNNCPLNFPKDAIA